LDSIQAIENAAEILDSSIKSVYPFFSRNPARLFSQNSGEIRVGMIADLLSFNEDFDLCDTWVSGKHVYSAVL
jgi:N-acetylglucosamine-6-phosphate deacetylase